MPKANELRFGREFMRQLIRAPKYFLLSALIALPGLALSGCGTKESSARTLSAAVEKQNSCRPASTNQALSEAMVAECDQGNPKPAVYVPKLPVPPVTPPTRACTTDHFTQTGSGLGRKLDVLFVMDTSSRMGHRWTEIAEHLEEFTEHLCGVDLRFAVILAHVDQQEGRLWSTKGQPKVLEIGRAHV